VEFSALRAALYSQLQFRLTGQQIFATIYTELNGRQGLGNSTWNGNIRAYQHSVQILE
jgi:hypothetical protein